MTATLLASLFTVIAASSVLAATTIAGVGNVPRGGTSTGSATFTFTENSASCFANASGSLTYTLTTAGVSFTGTPALSRPDSLGGTLTSNSTSFTISTTGADTSNVESMVVTGLKIKATTSAPLGAITATLTGTGSLLACVSATGTVTATGTLGIQVEVAGNAATINVTSACPFADTALPTPSQATFTTGGPDGRTLTGVTTLTGGVQTATFSAGANIHTVGQTVSQTVNACPTSLSPGTVVDAVVQETGVPTNVGPGEQNQPAQSTSIRELTAGYIPVGTLTWTLSAAGVQFSAPPTVSFTAPAAAPTGLAATPSTTGGAIPAGGHCYVVTTLTGVAAETTPTAPVCVTTTGATSSVVLTWTNAIGATGYNIYQAATSAGPFHLLTGNPVGPSPATVVGVTEAAGPILPPTTSTAGTVDALSLFAIGSVCPLSFDRMSCSVAVTHVSTTPVTVTLSNIKLDVAATVAPGTAVNVVVTSSPAINVAISSNNIANVARVIVGTAAQPLIYINFNDQATGMITLTEQAAGYFQSGTGNNNTLVLCITTGETFTRAPWAVVTGGTGLQLLSGLVGATSVIGTLSTTLVGHVGQSCAYWTVFTASTAAATIEIRGSDSGGAVLPSGALNGPRVSVGPTLAPGTTQMALYSGDNGTNLAFLGLVSNATRAFKSGVVVAAVSQPVIPAGTTDSLAGNITITETLNGQFKPGQDICVTILPRTSNGVRTQDTFIKSATTNDLPVITTNSASGLLASTIATPGCPPDFFFSFDSFDGEFGFIFGGGFTGPFLPNPGASFSFSVNQQSFGGTLGVITISNIHVTTTADAPTGAVLMDVGGDTDGGAVQFQTVVSNARIGSQLAGTNATRLGVTQTGAFTTSTKLPHLNRYVTYRIDFGVAAAGAHVDIWGATKTGNDWSAFTKITTRVANASGVVYYYIRQNAATWRSYRGSWAGGGVMTPARQAHWR